MARYGTDYTWRRYGSDFDLGESGYDEEFRGEGMGPGGSWRSRSGGWGWSGGGRYDWPRRSAGLGGLDNSWESAGHGRGRYPYYDNRPYTGSRPYYGGSRSRGYDYDEDIGDRLRRGWDRFRHQARGWMGRGYDRGW